MAAPTNVELDLLHAFRLLIIQESILPEDDKRLADNYFLIRWLRARNHDVGKAKDMLVTSLKWRIQTQADKMVDIPRESIFEEHVPIKIAGHDKEGRPLYFAVAGRWNFKEVIKSKTPEEVTLDFTRSIEIVTRLVAKGGNLLTKRAPEGSPIPVTQYVIIADMTGFGIAQASNWKALTRYMDIASALEAHYPETVYVVHILNCSRMFLWFLTLLKKCLHGETVHKLMVYGTNAADWYPKLLESIDGEYLEELSGVPGAGGGRGKLV